MKYYVSGNKKPAILADSVEAVIAAIYLDSNIEEAKKFIINNLKEAIEKASLHVGQKDYKTVLQEKLQIHGNVKIEYILLNTEGPDHDKTFIVEVKCDGKKLAIRRRKNKKTSRNECSKISIGKE